MTDTIFSFFWSIAIATFLLIMGRLFPSNFYLSYLLFKWFCDNWELASPRESWSKLWKLPCDRL